MIHLVITKQQYQPLLINEEIEPTDNDENRKKNII